jgi:hypothetical protein
MNASPYKGNQNKEENTILRVNKSFMVTHKAMLVCKQWLIVSRIACIGPLTWWPDMVAKSS